jgi:hypothetical protein
VSKVAQHAAHRADLGRLHRLHVVGEHRHVDILTGAWGVEEVAHHLERSFMVLNHELQEQAIEIRALRRAELRQLLRGEHAWHAHLPPRGGVGRELTIGPQPLLHEPDLGLLRLVDLLGELDEVLTGIVPRGQTGHVDGLRVMRDHALHEANVRLGKDGARWDRDGRQIHGHTSHLMVVHV